MTTTDRELLLAVSRGSDRAARELWSRHAGRLRAFLRSLLSQTGPVDADDILQQTFCRILETSPATLREVQDVPAWLFQVARHLAFNSGRSEKRERDRRGSPRLERNGSGGRAAATPRVLDGSAHDEALSRALSALMPDLRDVVLLKHVAGLTFDQIAVATQTNRNTAASRYRSALGLLEAALAPRHQGSPGVASSLAASGTPHAAGGLLARTTLPTEVSHG